MHSVVPGQRKLRWDNKQTDARTRGSSPFLSGPGAPSSFRRTQALEEGVQELEVGAEKRRASGALGQTVGALDSGNDEGGDFPGVHVLPHGPIRLPTLERLSEPVSPGLERSIDDAPEPLVEG